MRDNANCSEMVLISLTIVLYSTQLALLLEGYYTMKLKLVYGHLKSFLHFKRT